MNHATSYGCELAALTKTEDESDNERGTETSLITKIKYIKFNCKMLHT